MKPACVRVCISWFGSYDCHVLNLLQSLSFSVATLARVVYLLRANIWNLLLLPSWPELEQRWSFWSAICISTPHTNWQSWKMLHLEEEKWEESLRILDERCCFLLCIILFAKLYLRYIRTWGRSFSTSRIRPLGPSRQPPQEESDFMPKKDIFLMILRPRHVLNAELMTQNCLLFFSDQE